MTRRSRDGTYLSMGISVSQKKNPLFFVTRQPRPRTLCTRPTRALTAGSRHSLLFFPLRMNGLRLHSTSASSASTVPSLI